MAMDQAQTFEWMRHRIYEELEPRVKELESANAQLQQEAFHIESANATLREDLSQPTQNVLVPSVTSSGTGSEAERINKARHGLCTNDYHNRYIGDLESANARLQHEIEEARGHVLSERDKFKKAIARLLEQSEIEQAAGAALAEAARNKAQEAEVERLREALTKLDEAVAREDMNRGSEVYLHRIIREALQPPKEQA